MNNSISCHKSASLISAYPTMRFTTVTAVDVQPTAFKKQVRKFAEITAEGLQKENPSRESCLREFERFFRARKQPFPLSKQIGSAASHGFPPTPIPVLALLALEAATGILMGVQDLNAIEASITLDALETEESFTGMRGNQITCSPHEVVVRDERSIIASLFQGPDRRTAVEPGCRNILFYVFDTDTSLGSAHDRAVEKIIGLFPACVANADVLPAA